MDLHNIKFIWKQFESVSVKVIDHTMIFAHLRIISQLLERLESPKLTYQQFKVWGTSTISFTRHASRLNMLNPIRTATKGKIRHTRHKRQRMSWIYYLASRDKILPNWPTLRPIRRMMRWLLEHVSDSTFDFLRRLLNTQIGLLICMICRVGHEGMRRAMRVRGGRYALLGLNLKLHVR